MSSRAWLVSCLALPVLSAAAMLAAPPSVNASLAWQNEVWPEFWTLWSAALIDTSWGLWLANMAVLMALGALGHAMGTERRDALCLWLAWPLATWGLALFPQVQGVLGMGGVTHAAGAILIVRASHLKPDGLFAALAAGALLLKLVLEHAWKTPQAFNPHWHANVTYALHLSGAVSGALLAYGWPRNQPTPLDGANH